MLLALALQVSVAATPLEAQRVPKWAFGTSIAAALAVTAVTIGLFAYGASLRSQFSSFTGTVSGADLVALSRRANDATTASYIALGVTVNLAALSVILGLFTRWHDPEPEPAVAPL